MRNWASSGRVKIDRADEHIRHLDVEISDFRKRRPYIVATESHPHDSFGRLRDEFSARCIAFVVREREAIPLRWSAITADVIHNLNVALDHLWARALYGSVEQRHIQFPMFPDLHRAKPFLEREAKGRTKTAVDILRSVGAFRVGNPFWVIREFDNTDKHDTMVLVACLLRGVDLRTKHHGRLMLGELAPRPIRHIGGSGLFSPLRDGTPLLITAEVGPEVDVDHELAFEIAFGESEVLKGEPVVPALKNLAAAVDSLAGAFEAAGLLP